MTFSIPLKDARDHAIRWLTLYQGMLGFTDREREVLVELLVEYADMKDKILDPDLLWKNLLDTDTRQRIQQRLGITRFALGNYLTTFRKNKLFTEQGHLLPSLIPQSEFKVLFSGPTV